MDTSDRQSAPILMMSILEKAHYLPIFFSVLVTTNFRQCASILVRVFSIFPFAVGIKMRVKRNRDMFTFKLLLLRFFNNIILSLRSEKVNILWKHARAQNLGDNFVFPHIFITVKKKTGNEQSTFIQMQPISNIFITWLSYMCKYVSDWFTTNTHLFEIWEYM